MSTSAPAKAIESKVRRKVLKLSNLKKSSFVAKGTENTPNPIHQAWPGERFILNRAFTIVKENGQEIRKEIRYIKGVTNPFVDWQEKHNIKPSPVNLDDAIIFDKGQLMINDGAMGLALWNFIHVHPNFANNDNKDVVRPEGADDIFYAFEKEDVASKFIAKEQEENEAKQLVFELYADTPEGFKYAEKKIDFLCSLLRINEETYQEKVAALLFLAKKTPEAFLATIADKKNEYRASIGEAINLGVLNTDGKKATLTATGKEFLEFKTKGDTNKMDELFAFFTSDEGSMYYREMLIDADGAKRKAAITQTS